ncbi:head maturation protease, ClpP-related [Clostridium celatum]|uniref:ATP-dependent Clp protease proteolytic subunit n=1 Tax=Clostridium celatum DSM 1785 TaxID=545697 RepID=L1QJG1_9CLOT|nr:head maturation protease, ClpP-related [Clostridium celatum]EKY28081.1 endopeptidase Clp [Clostridium celatum DSM 1785]MCE9654156.1 Clp protease ClpP [Clostridium celatum]
MNKKFWNWVKNEEGRTLYFDGYIAQDSWFDDDITPKQFKSELTNSGGDIVVWLNSPGGDVFAASQIYNMLKEYDGKVTVKIDGIAASAASVIAMAGSEILMSPVAMMMIHNPATVIFGEASDLQSGIDMLSEVKESIINAYEKKTSLPRKKISKMMDAETWFSAQKAVELGFADTVLYEDSEEITDGFIFDKVTVTNALMRKIPKVKETQPVENIGTPHDQLLKRLELLKY